MNCGYTIPWDWLEEVLREESLERFDAIPDDNKKIAVGTSPAEEIDISDEVLSGTISPLMSSVGVDPSAGLNTGTRIILPDSVPTTWKPYLGARRGTAWHPRTRRTVALIRDKARKKNGDKIVCATYNGHGRTGLRFGIDAMISHFTQKANDAEEAAGDKLCNWIINNWNRLNVNYVIYWNWMNDGAGWFYYEPLRKRWDSGSSNLVASRHFDHIHIQVDSPFIAGNE